MFSGIIPNFVLNFKIWNIARATINLANNTRLQIKWVWIHSFESIQLNPFNLIINNHKLLIYISLVNHIANQFDKDTFFKNDDDKLIYSVLHSTPFFLCIPLFLPPQEISRKPFVQELAFPRDAPRFDRPNPSNIWLDGCGSWGQRSDFCFQRGLV